LEHAKAGALAAARKCTTGDKSGRRPFLLQEVLKPDGNEVISKTKPHLIRQVDAPADAFKLVQKAMRAAVTSGTGRAVDVPGVTVGGKTGSAECNGPAHGWFICFAPVEKPRIAIACIVEHGRHGATTAAPVCRAILDVFFGKKKPGEIGSGAAKVRGD